MSPRLILYVYVHAYVYPRVYGYIHAYVSAGQVIISIIGGTSNSDMSSTIKVSTIKDVLMKGLMDTRDLKPIFITEVSDPSSGSSGSSFMKYVGDAKAKHNSNAVKAPPHFQSSSCSL